MKKMLLALMLLGIVMPLTTCYAGEPCEQSTNQAVEFSIKNVLKELSIDALELGVSALVVGALATIIHEWGHIAAASTVFSMINETNVYIGTTNPEKDTLLRWFSLGNTHFYKKLPWFTGTSNAPYHFIPQDPWLREKQIFHLAAGGMSAALFLYGTLTLIMAYCSYWDNKTTGEIIDTSCRRAFSPFASILEAQNLSYQQKRLLMNLALVICISLRFNLIYGLLPLNSGDGMKIWQEKLGFCDKTLSGLQGATNVGFLVSLAWLVKCFYTARKALAQQLVINNNDTQPTVLLVQS